MSASGKRLAEKVKAEIIKESIQRFGGDISQDGHLVDRKGTKTDFKISTRGQRVRVEIDHRLVYSGPKARGLTAFAERYLYWDAK